LIEQQNNKAYI